MSDAAPPPQKTTQDNRALIILLSVVFINIAGFGVVIPLLPFYASSFGAPAWQVIILFSAYSLGNFFAEPLWGKLSDRIGRRPVLMLTIFGNALTYVLLAFAPDLWIAMLIRFGGGILTGNISTIQGYLADVTPPEKRAGRMGFIAAAFSLGFVTGPVLGGLLAHPDQGTAGFRLPLLIAAGLALTAGIGVTLFVRETRHVHKDAPRRARFEGLTDALAHPVIRRVLVVSLIAMAGFAGMEATFGLWAKHQFSWGPREISFCFLAIGVTAALAQSLLTGWMARRIGEAATLMCGLCLIALGFGFQPLVGQNWMIAVLGMIVVALGQSLAFPNIVAIISKSAPHDRQGEMLGLNTAAGALARIFGPLVAAPLFTGIGPSAPFAVAAGLCLPALFMAWRVSKAVRRSA
ncbi:MFS transporter [Caulobacter sp. NIBR1757]|uniref:MFS transporter n=1 Tax=Caulobacter sp. NIBR1757 TaxID=3016000 RepID=UPI0022EFE9BB|nr:MFS transporter [Caulobacter sp. NIBR1757]WGM40161.1 Tetracycline resistance protein, class C [Caulobacter sp. NIBR1757]